MATFPEIFNGLLFRSIMSMRVQNLKFEASPVPQTIGYYKFGHATLPFLRNF